MNRAARTVLCWMLAVSMVVSPPLVYAQQPAAGSAPATDAEKLDLSYVTPEAVLAAVARPRRVLTAPEMEMLPIEVFSAAGKKELGIDPLDVEQVMVIVEPPKGSPPAVGAVIRFSRPYQLEGVMMRLAASTVEAELEGTPYRQGQGPMPSLYMPDDRTLLVAHDSLLRKMVANRKAPAEGPLSKLLAATDTSSDLVALATIEPVREMLSAALAAAPVPPPLEGLKRVPELLTAAKLQLDVTGTVALSLTLLARDEPAAEELEELINGLLDFGRQMALAQVTQQLSGDDPVQQATAQYIQRINERMVETLRPVRKGNVVRLSQEGAQYAQTATIGILVALLLPAVQAAREAARRAQSTNNLKQIGLAMHMYHDANGRFPARANFDESGKPLLGWRVHILPYIEQQALYKQFHLDEPWDSEHNKKLIPLMPSVYRNPSSKAEPNKATYLVPVGEGTIFGAQGGSALKNITDGSASTIMALEVNDEAAVIWTKPEDWQYDPDRPLAGLGKAHPGGFLALFADGSVRFLAGSIDLDVLRKLLTMADGKPVVIP